MDWRKTAPVVGAMMMLATACTGSIFGDDAIEASGEIIEDARDLEAFSSVSIDGPVDVTIVSDGTHRVEMRMDRELERRAMIEIGDDEFSLDFPDDMSVRGPIVAELILHVDRLDDLDVESTASVAFDRLVGDTVLVDVSGASEVSGGEIVAGRLELGVSGASVVEVELAIDAVTRADMSGASLATLAGRTGELVLDASGASDVAALDLETGPARLDLSGASSVRISSSGAVDGELSGASDLHVRGDATIDVATSGASTVARS
ncbi:MAG: DUF2807 domain-containing protein [Actinomycetota bacterium]